MGLGFEVDVAVAVLVLVLVVVVVVLPPPELWRSITSRLSLLIICRGCDFVGVMIAVAFSNALFLRTMGEASTDASVAISNNEMSNENRKHDFIFLLKMVYKREKEKNDTRAAPFNLLHCSFYEIYICRLLCIHASF